MSNFAPTSSRVRAADRGERSLEVLSTAATRATELPSESTGSDSAFRNHQPPPSGEGSENTIRARSRGRKSALRDDGARYLAEIQSLENEIVGLEEQLQGSTGITRAYTGRTRDPNSKRFHIARKELESLDEDTLTDVLTKPKDSVLERLLACLPPDKSLFTAPALSVGLEGTGPSVKVDKHTADSDDTNGVSRADRQRALVDALEGRRRRAREVLEALARFSGIAFTSLESSNAGQQIAIGMFARTISLRGFLPGDLGAIAVEVDVEEYQSAGHGPRMKGLRFQACEEVEKALGRRHSERILSKANLTALLLSLRTLPQIARSRLNLMRLIAKSYPELASGNMKSLKAQELGYISFIEDDVETVSLRSIVDPRASKLLILQNMRGSRLAIIFTVSFNKWGHARPMLRIKPLPSLVTEGEMGNAGVADPLSKLQACVMLTNDCAPGQRISAVSERTLDETPTRFAHLCAHAPSRGGRGLASGIQLVIRAYFNLDD